MRRSTVPVPTSSRPELKRRLLKDEAYDAIRQAIMDGSFQPGEHLDDVALQEWLGISRTPIRDALMNLQRDGLVEIVPQAHTKVVDAHPEVVEANIQTLGVVLGGVVRVTVPALDASAHPALAAATRMARDAVAARDRRAHVDAALEVYSAIIDLCPNAVLKGVAQETVARLVFQVQLTIDTREPNWALLADGWERFDAAIDARDPIAAELAFEEMHRLPLPYDTQWAPATWTTK